MSEPHWRLFDMSMAGSVQTLGEAHEKDLYNRVHDATKKAQIEGDAQLQAAVAAARAPPASISNKLVRLDTWSFKFENGKLERAYRQTVNTACNSSCSCNDYIPMIIKLAFTFPDLVWLLTSFRRSRVTGMADQSWIGARHFWHLLVAVVCISFLILKVGASKWYRSHRGSLLHWFILILWFSESVNLLLLSHVRLWELVMEVIAPCVYMSFLQVAPFSFHLRLRMLGFGGQFGVVLVGQNGAQAYQALLGILVGHFVGVGVACYLDRRARVTYLKSLPWWFLEEVTGVAIQPASLFTCWANIARRLWSIFYPGFIDISKSRKDELSHSSAARPRANCIVAPRRALGGFAGGFGGVSGLKSTSITTIYHPIPVSSLSPSSSDQNGDIDSSTSDEECVPETSQNGSWDAQLFQPNGQPLGPRARAFPRYKRHQGNNTEGSHVQSGSGLQQHSRADGIGQPDTDDEW